MFISMENLDSRDYFVYTSKMVQIMISKRHVWKTLTVCMTVLTLSEQNGVQQIIFHEMT